MEGNVSSFFSSHSHELQSKMKRLDFLIGRDHWLSVGNYKEELLRILLKQLLPKRYEISTGFILALDPDGKEIKSKQQDIIVWDSVDYAAIFRDGDFVIVPPEACRVVIEVKSTLTSDTLKKAMLASDGIFDFVRTPHIQNINISKYIFAYGSDLSFPLRYFDTIHDFYENDVDGQLSIEQRIEFTRKHWPQSNSANLASLDGIFVLGTGAVLRTIRGYPQEQVKFIYEAFELKSDQEDHVYTFFEHTLNTVINSPNNRPGLYYAKQPGLFSMMQKIALRRPETGGTMVYPYSPDILSEYTELNEQMLYSKK
ncbi:DUF6602 domain-containing protein [Photobacterium sp. GB-56]|uniref:DUF6602 domain-containing protein n=1 Tax=Photobacterium sp. GB-56 TaxID=2022106 RepID=UPI000D1844DD|nr:DUF6602 domain-containing protein [Photobacterium sp. GB-56]PSV28113.1 hypothetical protein C9J42_02810 [Photobacterium sp. GB-56]